VQKRIITQLRGTSPAKDPSAAALGRLRPEIAGALFTGTLIPAAVLIPLVLHDSGLTVLLTQRTEHLTDHPGQISFPGGRVDKTDRDPLHTALREAEEEIGLAPEDVRVAGYLEPYAVVTGFVITPVVGFIRPGIPLVLDDFEVADAFEVPLSFFIDSRNRSCGIRKIRDVEVALVEYEYEGRRIWGATAQILDIFINDIKQ
jgi:8-oxo-dGTP pyrophosphatase MutT (NUDIX family)